MSKIRIVNWLLTRKCNLKCDYCAIVKNYSNKPASYPDMSHYIKNEMTAEMVISGLALFKKHNPSMFHIFYGGEPMLVNGLPRIINYCNDNEIFYTIISNNTPEIQFMIKKLFKETGYVDGFTSSVDPIFNEVGVNEDRVKKSIEGLLRLKEIQEKGLAKDVVAEITVMNHNQHLLPKLLEELSKSDIYSDITFVDIAKNNYYDFSNISEESQLVKPTFELAKMFVEIMNNKNLLIHMKDILIPKMFDTLPSNFDCGIEKNLHNITIDADGTVRLCLRIRGVGTPRMTNLSNIFVDDDAQKISDYLIDTIISDKKRLCRLCNHSCLMMSKHIDENETGEGDLVHIDKRGDN